LLPCPAPGLKVDSPLLLGPLAALALLAAAAAVLYVKTFYGVRKRLKRMRVPRHFRPALGALATGAAAFEMPAAFLP